MGFGHDLFQALLDSFWRRLVRKCGRGQGEHCGNWLAQVVGSLLDGACLCCAPARFSPAIVTESTA